MSLKDQLREGLYDVEHKPRLAYARGYFLGYEDRYPGLKWLEDFYVKWRNFDENMVVQKQTDSLIFKGE